MDKTPTAAFEQNRGQRPATTPNFNVNNASIGIAADRDMDRWQFNEESPQAGSGLDEFNFGGNMSINMNSNMNNIGNMDNSFTWEMIGLGLEEPLPPQDTIDEL